MFFSDVQPLFSPWFSWLSFLHLVSWHRIQIKAKRNTHWNSFLATTTTTTVAPIVTSASWSFDQTTADAYGVYNGILINGASYTTISSTQPYIGNGRALNLIAGANQSFLVNSPFFNLSAVSFTIEAWVYPTDTTGDRAIFGQCACSTCTNQCFYLILRSGNLYGDFNFNGVVGSTTLLTSNWYHVVFVYNSATQQQILYVNGIQDNIASNVNPYQGANGLVQIGAAQVSVTKCYFVGFIDSVKITTRAKSAAEILFDASVIAYYSFDISSQNNDNGPNGLNGSSTNTAFVQGRVNQAMRFYGTGSYFRAYGFYQFSFSVVGAPYSLSLWVNPSAFANGVIIQLAQGSPGTACFNLLGIVSSTSTTGQLMMQAYGNPSPIIYGPLISLNTWIHVSITCSSTNGMILYLNGIRYGSTGAFGPSGASYPSWFQIGYSAVCGGGNVPTGPFQGAVDEVYAHSRELTQADVTALANP